MNVQAPIAAPLDVRDHFPAIAGWLPAHTPKLAQVPPPAQPEMETQDRVETPNEGVKP